jgi:hypothetical protein
MILKMEKMAVSRLEWQKMYALAMVNFLTCFLNQSFRISPLLHVTEGTVCCCNGH